MSAANAPEKKSLDDVLLAMDVVDTLRHREAWLTRELDVEGREESLINRLREIYDAQGIEVPDHVLQEGVRALEEKRFAYTPPQGGLQVALAQLYVSRDRWGLPTLAVVGALLASLIVWQLAFAGPERARAAAQRTALKQVYPDAIRDLTMEIDTIAEEDKARRLAEALLAEGEAAIAAGDAVRAEGAVTALRTLRNDLLAVYEVTVVSRPGVLSGVFRIPDDVPDARNYYLIVEGVDATGKPVEVTLTSEEDQSTRRVTRWGQRVSEATFNRVAADKGDDQIIQNAVIGQKRRGYLSPDYSVATPGGVVFEW